MPSPIPAPVVPQPAEPSSAAQTYTGLGFIVVTALFFGSAPTFARLAFDGGAGALTLQLARFALAGVGLGLLLALTGRPMAIRARHLPLLAALVVLSGGASYGYMTSVRSIPVPVASLVFSTFPLMVGPLAHLIGDERLTARGVLALVVGFSGIALLLEGWVSHADPLGLALAFGAGSCVAVSFQVSRRLTVDIPPLLLTAAVASACAVLCAALIALSGDLEPPTGARGWTGLLGNAVAYTVGLSCLFAAIQRLGTVRAAVAVNLEPVVSVVLAGIVLGDALTGTQLTGALVVLGGIVLAQGRRRQR